MGALTVQRYLFDTNILIYYFNGEMENSVAQTITKLMKENFQISVISKMEFLGFPFNHEEKQQAIKFIEYAEIKMLTYSVVQKVIEIRQHKKMKLPDAIIAATAIESSSVLITRNTKDFNSLKLEVFDPFKDFG
jgi:predicted nucleic acid-binding protein